MIYNKKFLWMFHGQGRGAGSPNLLKIILLKLFIDYFALITLPGTFLYSCPEESW
jgi:hypothetical protein